MKEIKQLFTEKVLSEIIERFGLDRKKTELIHAVDNFIFNTEQQSNQLILRITHESVTSKREMESLFRWRCFLQENGVPLCDFYRSQNGKIIEEFKADDGSYFYVNLIEKAEGEFLDEKKELVTKALIYNWGRTVGRMHKLTKKYQMDQKEDIFPIWHDFTPKMKNYLKNEQVSLKKLELLISKLNNFSKDKDSYGLIHYDLHHFNFTVSNNQLQIFDFDDTEFNWFVSDIAVILFTIKLRELNGDEPMLDFIRYFFRNFMEGYQEENKINRNWIEKLPELIAHRVFYQYSKTVNAIKNNEIQPWTLRLYKQWKYMIEKDIPYIDINFIELID